MKNKLIILIGIAGSGKSTYAKQIIRESNGSMIRANRDDTRTALFGLDPYDHSSHYLSKGIGDKEKMVTEILDQTIAIASDHNKSVVDDNTNLKLSNIKAMISGWESIYYVQIKIMTIDLEVAIQRDSDRQRTVGRKVIEKQYSQLKNLLDNPEFKELYKIYGT